MERLAYIVIGVALGVTFTVMFKTPKTADVADIEAPKIDSLRNEVEEREKKEPSPEMHQHPLRMVSDKTPFPSVTHLVFPDIMGGYNIQIIPRNFKFTPADINREVRDNEGHAHVYVNGIKVSRVYSKWFFLSASFLQKGENTVSVTLNANDHSEWAIDGQKIMSSVRVFKKN